MIRHVLLLSLIRYLYNIKVSLNSFFIFINHGTLLNYYHVNITYLSCYSIYRFITYQETLNKYSIYYEF